jgi:glycosyltransferase involved in cell wall biosynthesis
MNILICNERFLFRFGADRVLILLGKGLKELGHTVTMMANRYDPEIVQSFASQVIDCPVEHAAYLDLNEYTSDWLRNNWNRLFLPGNIPDVIIVGGWPFVSALAFFREVCPNVVFLDQGVVPTDGYPDTTKITLEKLRALRKQHLGFADLIIGVSRFIVDSQSRPESGGVPVRSILNGADHMEMRLWPADRLRLESAPKSSLLVRSLKQQGRKVLLCLGRWEPGCYKNSQVALEMMERLNAASPACTLLVLAEGHHVDVPANLKNAILPIGFPDDPELVEIMKAADLGMSFSLWEGFNLPLAEMQWLGRPALVFNLGAHSEVVADPWYLCRDIDEMSTKAQELLVGRGPDSATISKSLAEFRSYFRWERAISEYNNALNELASRNDTRTNRLLPLSVIDVSNSTIDPANSGVIRVTRRLSRELQEHGADPIFVIWDQSMGRYVLPTHDEYEMLSRFNGPLPKGNRRLSGSPGERRSIDDILSWHDNLERWLLLPEVKAAGSLRAIQRFARDRNLMIAAIFYDSIPVSRPDLCNEEIRENHGRYMQGLAECDLVIPISDFSARCLEDFWHDSDVTTSCRVIADLLPGEFGGTRRTSIIQESKQSEIRILCVSTLEPRKNHRNLIQACLWIADKYPELEWSLTLVGNRYAGAFEIADWIESISAKNSRIKWLGVVDDATLDRLYQESAFTVYPSVIEGFGLPVLESIWHGRPCICYNQGVMSELAQDGGCLTTDVTDPIRLAETIYTLATNEDLRLKLARQAIARPLKTWNDYVLELTETIAEYARARASFERTSPAISTSRNGTRSMDWQSALYPDCICENWQMSDSERMALTGLIARHKPFCSIEVGTYCGGSLSLISQYSKMVFSIDIDETISSRFSFPNVSFLTGRSTLILPHLFNELDKANIPVEFLLIDGDHSAAGVLGDLNCLLDYVPRRPLFVVLHDSFNPECRRGMLEANWQRSPFCHWVDIDFVPGRVVEYPGPFHGELWGGLAAAYFLPEPRTGELQVGRTAEQMFRMLNEQRASAATA